MKRILLSFCMFLNFSVIWSMDFDFDVSEEEAQSISPEPKKEDSSTPKAAEVFDLDEMQAQIDADSEQQRPEPIRYPAVPQNKKPEKKEDPTVTAYRKMAMGLKTITYDQLPQPLKDVFEEYVFDPLANHLKKNIKFTGLAFKRIPEVYSPGEKEHAFLIIGNLILYNQKAKAILREMTFEKGKPHYSLTIEFTEGVQLSDLAKELSIIDLDVQKLQIVFSDWKYEAQELGGITVEKGLNLIGDVQMVGALKPINLLTKLSVLRMYGTIKKGLVGTTINGLIPGNVPIGKGATLTKMSLGVEIIGKLPLNTPAPQFRLRGDLKVDIQGVAEPVTFTSFLELAAEKATLSGALDGTWENPFGIKGLSIGDVGIGASVLYTGAVPDGFAIKGVIELADKKFLLATKGSVTDGAAFIGTMKGDLSYKDIVNFTNKSTGAGLPVDTIFTVIPNVIMQDPTLQIVPVATTIIGTVYPQGVTFDGAITIFGKKTAMKIAVLKDGIKGSALLPELEVKDLFSIKGTKGSDGIKKAPKVMLNITKSTSKIAEFYAKGFVELAPALLGGASADGFIDFTAFGTDITMKSKLFDQFMFDIELKSKVALTQPPVNLTIKATMAADGGIGDVTKRIRQAAVSVLGNPTKLEAGLKEQTNKCFRQKTGNVKLDVFK